MRGVKGFSVVAVVTLALALAAPGYAQSRYFGELLLGEIGLAPFSINVQLAGGQTDALGPMSARGAVIFSTTSGGVYASVQAEALYPVPTDVFTLYVGGGMGVRYSSGSGADVAALGTLGFDWPSGAQKDVSILSEVVFGYWLNSGPGVSVRVGPRLYFQLPGQVPQSP